MFTIGTDSECFLRSKDSGRLVSAIPFINGTKHEPQPLPGGNIQRDNVAMEVATDPASDLAQFVGNVGSVLKNARCVIPKLYEIDAVPSANFPEDQLDHPEALQFGCDADYDAYKVRENDKPVLKNPLFRSCGGHIHVGTGDNPRYDFLKNFHGKIDMVKTMDAVHGIVSTLLDHSPQAVERRSLYGKAGTHRPKSYGVEYRVLSNFWIKSPLLVSLMYNLTKDALELMAAGKALKLIEAIGADKIRATINDGLYDDAVEIMNSHVRPLLSEDSLVCLDKALAAGEFDLKKEWKLEEVAQ